MAVVLAGVPKSADTVVPFSKSGKVYIPKIKSSVVVAPSVAFCEPESGRTVTLVMLVKMTVGNVAIVVVLGTCVETVVLRRVEVVNTTALLVLLFLIVEVVVELVLELVAKLPATDVVLLTAADVVLEEALKAELVVEETPEAVVMFVVVLDVGV